MSGKPKDFDDTARLISALLDGSLKGIERTRLELQLESDPAARRLYLQMIDQEIELQFMAVPADDAVIVSMTAALEQQVADRRARHRRWAAGMLAAAAAAVILVAVRWPQGVPVERPRPPVAAATVAESWAADFEDGNARGWEGTLVTTGLPAGSKYGLAAARQIKPYGTVWDIESPANWDDGFVSLTTRSTLHVTYRLNGTALRDVFLHTIPSAAGQPSMYRLTGSQFPGPAGQWQTASIPFALFSRKEPNSATGELKFTGGPPEDGETIAVLSFSAPHAVDLVIDRIWITPDGTGSETIQPLP